MTFIDDIIKESFNETLESWRNQGVTEEEISKRIAEADFEAIIQRNIDSYVNNIFEELDKSKQRMLADYRIQESQFVSSQISKWKDCFDYSDLLYIMILDFYSSYKNYIDNRVSEDIKESKKYTFACLHTLHGRACQIYQEILCLLKNGFPDAAFARWRTMYEVCCIAEFIKNNGENVAKAYYYDNSQKNLWAKEADCFKNHKKLNGRIAFSNIEKHCEFTKKGWNDIYKLSCLAIHANPQGTFTRATAPHVDSNLILVGRVGGSIAFLATRAAFTLRIITSFFFNLFYSADSISYVFTINKFSDKIYEMYLEADKTLFPELYQNKSE